MQKYAKICKKYSFGGDPTCLHLFPEAWCHGRRPDQIGQALPQRLSGTFCAGGIPAVAEMAKAQIKFPHSSAEPDAFHTGVTMYFPSSEIDRNRSLDVPIDLFGICDE